MLEVWCLYCVISQGIIAVLTLLSDDLDWLGEAAGANGIAASRVPPLRLISHESPVLLLAAGFITALMDRLSVCTKSCRPLRGSDFHLPALRLRLRAGLDSAPTALFSMRLVTDATATVS